MLHDSFECCYGWIVDELCLPLGTHIKAAKGNYAEPTEVVPTEVVMIKNGVCDVCKVACRGGKGLAKFTIGTVVIFMCEDECFKVYVIRSYAAGTIAYKKVN